MFHGVADAVGLLALVDAAVRSSEGADTEIDNERCRLRVCAWASAPGTGAADAVHFSVRLYTDSTGAGTPRGVVHLAEFQRRSGDAFVFWRVLRRALDALVAAGAGAGGATFTVAPMAPWGAEASPRGDEPPCGPPSAPETAMALREEDVRPVVEMVRAVYEDVRVEGCKMAASVAAAVRYSGVGLASCVSTGLVGAVVEVLGTRCGVESRTAAATALAEWVSTDLGLAAVMRDAAACRVSDARRALKACVDGDGAAADYTARHLRREAARALGRVGRE